MRRQTPPVGTVTVWRFPVWPFVVFLCAMACCTFVRAQQESDECALTMGWETWHPYQFIDSQGTLSGFDIEFVEAVASSIGCTVKHREVNWARGLVDLRNGALDLIASANYTRDRTVWAYYSDSYRDSSIVLFTRKGESAWYPFATLLDMIGTDFRLGVGRGVTYSEEFSLLVENPEFKKHLVYIPTSELQQYQMLKASRVDGFLRSITALRSLQEELGNDVNLEVHPLVIDGGKQHIILSKASVPESLYRRFNEGLRNVRSEGILDSLMTRYF